MDEVCVICLDIIEEGHDCMGYELGRELKDGLDLILEEAKEDPTFENKTIATLSLMMNFLIDIRKDINFLLERVEK